MVELPDIIPLFPLPNVVHFPGVLLPLHVFEERYRDLVRDQLEGQRLIGIVLLRRGWEEGYHGRPAVFAVGTAGEITRAERLPDGRYNVALEGRREFRIVAETEGGTSYRRACVDWLEPVDEPISAATGARVWGLARTYLAARRPGVRLPGRPRPGSDPALVVNFFAQHLDLEPVERQALLEARGGMERAERLIAALEFRIRAEQMGGGPGPETLQ